MKLTDSLKNLANKVGGAVNDLFGGGHRPADTSSLQSNTSSSYTGGANEKRFPPEKNQADVQLPAPTDPVHQLPNIPASDITKTATGLSDRDEQLKKKRDQEEQRAKQLAKQKQDKKSPLKKLAAKFSKFLPHRQSETETPSEKTTVETNELLESPTQKESIQNDEAEEEQTDGQQETTDNPTGHPVQVYREEAERDEDDDARAVAERAAKTETGHTPISDRQEQAARRERVKEKTDSHKINAPYKNGIAITEEEAKQLIALKEEVASDRKGSWKQLVRETQKILNGNLARQKAIYDNNMDVAFNEEWHVDTASQSRNPNQEPKEIKSDDRLLRKAQEAQDKTIRLFMNPHFRIEGMKVDVIKNNRDGSYRMILKVDGAAGEAISSIISLYDNKITLFGVMQLIILRTSLSIDNKGRLVGKSAAKFTLSKEQCIRICEDIRRSQEVYHHPLHFFEIENTPSKTGGTINYPAGYIPKSLKRSLLQASCFKDLGIDEKTLDQIVYQDYVENTRAAILIDTYNGDESLRAQKFQLDNSMRAYLRVDGYTDTREWGIQDLCYITWTDIMDNKTEIMMAVDDPYATENVVAKQVEVTFNNMAKRLIRKNKKKVYTNVGGSEVSFIDKKTNIGEAFGFIAGMMRSAGTIANPVIIASGAVEHSVGNIVSAGANYGIRQALGLTDPNYRMTYYLKELMKSDEAVQTLSMYTDLYNIAGRDACVGFALDTRHPHNPQGMAAFIDQTIRTDKAKAKYPKSVLKKLDKMSRDIIEGNTGLRRADAKRFLDMVLINEAIASKERPSNLTAEEIEQLMSGPDGIGNTIGHLLATNEGWDAFIGVSNQNVGRRSPLSYGAEYLLRKNGVVDFLITDCFEKYVTYGLNFMQLWLPMSNTISYMVTKGLVKIAPNGSMIKDAQFYQMGGTDEFLTGLAKNLIYDIFRMLNIGMVGLFWCAFIMAMGLEDPDDDDDKYNWLQYKIGGENWIPAWWMNDLSSWGLPFGMALAVYLNHPDDAERIQKVFWNGCYSMMEGTTIIDAINFVTNTDENIQQMRDMISDPTKIGAPDIPTIVGMEFVQFGADTLRNLTPAVIRDFFPGNKKDSLLLGNEDWARSDTQVYKTLDDIGFVGGTEEERNAKRQEIRDLQMTKRLDEKGDTDDYIEYRLRNMSKDNPLLALGLNLTRNGFLYDNGTSDKTSYLYEERPISTKKDPLRAWWFDRYDFSYDDLAAMTTEEQGAYKQLHLSMVLEDIASFDSPQEAFANGYIIPYEERKNATELLYQDIVLQQLNFYERKQSGDFSSGAEKEIAYATMKSSVDKDYKILKDWLQSDYIPFSDESYYKRQTDVKKDYYWPNGDPATGIDYLLNPWCKVRYTPMGNPKTSFLPFTRVRRHDEEIGYNGETINNWVVPGLTNPKKIHDMLAERGAIAKSGQDKDKVLSELLYGGQGELGDMSNIMFPGNEDLHITPYDGAITKEAMNPLDSTYGAPTIGYRSWVYGQRNLPSDITDMDVESIAKQMGVDLNSMKGGGSGSYSYGNGGHGWYRRSPNYRAWKKYGGSGGGGGAYNPKIYSTPGRVYNTKAAGLNSRPPYKATSTYLRPGFVTKGSREAYRRNDI